MEIENSKLHSAPVGRVTVVSSPVARTFLSMLEQLLVLKVIESDKEFITVSTTVLSTIGSVPGSESESEPEPQLDKSRPDNNKLDNRP